MSNLGTLGESRVVSELIREGYDVFTQFSGKSSFDMVASKDNSLLRVEVKSSATRTKYDTGWEVQLKKVRPNRSGNSIQNFCQSQCDLLCVYVEPIDKVFIYKSSEITTKSSMVIKD